MFSFSIKWKISFSIGVVFPFWNIWKNLLVKFFEHGGFCGIFKIIDLMFFLLFNRDGAVDSYFFHFYYIIIFNVSTSCITLTCIFFFEYSLEISNIFKICNDAQFSFFNVRNALFFVFFFLDQSC